MEKEIQAAEVQAPWYKNQGQLALLKRTFAKDATNDEFALFVGVAKRTGLDPFSKQIYCVKRKGQMTVQAGIDGYRAIAERSGTLAGIDDAVYDSEENKFPKKATVTVYRMVDGIRVSFTASARWSEYYPGEKMGFMWNKMPYLMLGKCAEALALRKAFPNDLSGIYTTEEMAQAGSEPIHAEVKAAVVNDKKREAEELMANSDHEPIEKENLGFEKDPMIAEAIEVEAIDTTPVTQEEVIEALT